MISLSKRSVVVVVPNLLFPNCVDCYISVGQTVVCACNFQRDWKENVLFIEDNVVANCLMRYKMLNKISKYNLERHITQFHMKDFDKYKDNKRTCVVEHLKRELHNKHERGHASVVRVSYR